MISRRSAKAIADAYHERFTYYEFRTRHSSPPVFHFLRDDLYDFLFVNDFDQWLLNAAKQIPTHDRGLRDYLLRLHTGESVAPSTSDWDWEQRRTFGQRLLRDLAGSLLKARHTDPKFEQYGHNNREAADNMQRTLELDGYLYRDGVLLAPEETVLDEREEEGMLESLATSLGLQDVSTIKHHLSLSASHYQESRWDDSISNSRKVLEAVLQQVAARRSAASPTPIPAAALEKPFAVRDYLESAGLLERKEKEAIAAVYGLLSDTGAHPNIAHRDQARLMRHLALTFSQFVLLRLQGLLGGSAGPIRGTAS